MDLIETHILQTQLEEYAAGGLYPFHMPGHKRRMEPAPELPFSWDVTEVPGTDDLHDASGILREAMERTARQCGADRTWYLVNGSTCGLLAGIRALVRGGEVLCARNCHKAVYHALELAGCRVHWIMPPIDPVWGICGSISADSIAKTLRRHPSVGAVILTSPTYEGVLSEIEEICNVCHALKIPVLVDEAHGAHLMPASARAGFPAGALACGADVVVQSPHKTLPSLTQTALLHLKGGLVDPVRIEEQLDIFETSSPSYPLLASLDGCTGILRARGEMLFERWALRIGRFEENVRHLRRIRILRHTQDFVTDRPETTMIGADLYDPGKILIDASAARMTGAGLAGVLREKYHMETEMAEGNLLLAMTSLCDDEEALDRLAAALSDIEARTEENSPDALKISKEPKESKASKASAPHTPPEAEPDLSGDNAVPGVWTSLASLRPAAACSLAAAALQEKEPVPLSDAVDRISAQYMYFYPPGIPFLAPGEIITSRILHLIEEARRNGESVYRGTGAHILCLRE